MVDILEHKFKRVMSDRSPLSGSFIGYRCEYCWVWNWGDIKSVRSNSCVDILQKSLRERSAFIINGNEHV